MTYTEGKIKNYPAAIKELDSLYSRARRFLISEYRKCTINLKPSQGCKVDANSFPTLYSAKRNEVPGSRIPAVCDPKTEQKKQWEKNESHKAISPRRG